MSKWLETLGFGAQKPKRKSSPEIARIRETMRWRGYDLEAYSDDEIATASRMLGDGISETGETTHDGREALAALLKDRRQQGLQPVAYEYQEPATDETSVEKPAPAPESLAWDESPIASASFETPATEDAPTAEPADEQVDDAEEPPVREEREPEPSLPTRAQAEPVPIDRRAPGPGPSATPLESLPTGYKPAPGRYKSPLLLAWHGLGFHSWKYTDTAPGPRLRCDGCGQERPAGRNARPRAIAGTAPQTGSQSTAAGSEAQPRPDAARDAWSSDRSIDDPELRTSPAPRPAAPRPRSSDSDGPTLLQRALQSPWWVKTMAIFFLLQVVRVIASAFG